MTNKNDGGRLQILAGRYRRAEAALAEQGVGAWITLGRETHLLGEPAMLFLAPMTIFRHTALILTPAGGRICVCAGIEAEELRVSGLFTEITEYKTPADFEAVLAGALAALIPLKKIALNFSRYDPSSDGLSHSDFLLLERILKKTGFEGEIVSSEPLMKKVRGKKSDAEAGKIKKAAQAAAEIYELARPLMETGMSGKDVRDLFQRLADGRGLGYSWQKEYNPYVSVGARSSYNCKMAPSDVFIQPGDVVNVDFGILSDGYASDNQRTFYAPESGETEAPAEVRRAFGALQSVNRAVCAAMKTGTDSRSLSAVGSAVMSEYGFDGIKFASYGHEIGLFAHVGGIAAGENAFSAFTDTLLEENMTFTLEPAVVTSRGRVCQEEMVCVKSGGGVMLSTPQKEIWIIKNRPDRPDGVRPIK